MKNRKGQAVNATYLLSMIALFIVLYIILLPEGEKERLTQEPGQDDIFGSTDTYGYGPSDQFVNGPSAGAKTFISESPGVVYPTLKNVFSKPLASVNLFSEGKQQIDDLAGSISVSHNLFSETTKVVTFSFDDVAQVNSASLLFSVTSGEGNLIIKLNNQEIYNQKIETSDLPLSLPKHLLKQNNKLEFAVSAPGVFGENAYELQHVQLVKQLQLQNNLETRTFILSEGDKKNLQGLTLYYFVNCFTVQEQGRLIVKLNGNIISDNLVVCDAGEVSIDLDPQMLISGRNVLEFSIDQGKYVLEKVLVEGAVQQDQFPSYTFVLSRADIDQLRRGGRMQVNMRFFDDGYRKALNLHINGRPLYVDTTTGGFFADVTDYVLEGQNVVRVVPAFELEIVDLEVFLG